MDFDFNELRLNKLLPLQKVTHKPFHTARFFMFYIRNILSVKEYNSLLLKARLIEKPPVP